MVKRISITTNYKESREAELLTWLSTQDTDGGKKKKWERDRGRKTSEGKMKRKE